MSNDHDAVWNSCRRQIVEATYNAPHSQPPVNLCGGPDGCRVEVFGEEVFYGDFASASAAYNETRKLANWAVTQLSNTQHGRKVR